MKNFIITFATILCFSAVSFASNIGDGTLSIIKNESVTFTLTEQNQKELIISSIYNDENNQLSFEFESEVQMISIINANEEIEMMVPVSSKKINLGLSLFDQGSYKMGFLIEGENEVQYTSISIN